MDAAIKALQKQESCLKQGQPQRNDVDFFKYSQRHKFNRKLHSSMQRQIGVKPPAGNEPESVETGSHRVSGGQTVAVGPLSGTIKIEKKSPYLALTRLAQVTLN